MYKSTTITYLGIVLVIFSQVYWLYNLYQADVGKYQTKCDELFNIAISLEVNYRWSDKPINLKNPKLIVKSAKDMTPEERAKLKGDTITLDRAKKENLGKSLTEILQQKLQDDYMLKKPLNINALDSLFSSELLKADCSVSYQIYQFDKDKKIIGETKHIQPKRVHYIYTTPFPIGTEGLMFVQAKVGIPTNTFLQNMLFSLITSASMIILLISCLYRQLYVINRTRKQLKEREDAVYHAIHDLKAPLSTTYIMMDYLLRKEMKEKWIRVLTNNKKQIKKLTETIESMLLFAKNNEKRVSLTLQEVDLPEWVNGCYNTVAQLYPDKPHQFQLEADKLHQPTQPIDAARLERCLCNLIENAFKYSDNDVRIVAQIEEQNGKLILSITDTGWGIPKKELKKLGKQFYRAQHPDKPATLGYGIGLSSVMQLTKELGGKLSFLSKEQVGSTFTITLPLHIKK